MGYNEVEDEFSISYKSKQGIVWGFDFNVVNLILGIVCLIIAVGTFGLAIVGALNVLPGVEFLKDWFREYNIMWMVFSLSFLLVTLALFMGLKLHSRGGKYKRPWQFNYRMLSTLLTISVIVIISVLVVSMYAFNIGNVKHFCDADTCNVYAYTQYKLTFAILAGLILPLTDVGLSMHFIYKNRDIVVGKIDRADLQRAGVQLK